MKVLRSVLIQKILSDQRNFPAINLAISNLKQGQPLRGEFFVDGVKKQFNMSIVSTQQIVK